MKKVMALLMALILVLSLVACGGSSSEEKQDDTLDKVTEEVVSETVYSIGDTVKTDVAEVTVTNVDFCDRFNGCSADEGYKFVRISFSLHNIGKKEITSIYVNDKYHPYEAFYNNIYYIPFVDYNDGYTFFVDKVKSYPSSNFGTNKINVSELKPLSEAVNCDSAIYVPEEVETNTTAPLLIRVVVPSSEDSELFAYKVR